MICRFCHSSSSSSRLSSQGGSGCLDTLLHSTLSLTLSKSTTLPSSRTQSTHRFLGRPLLLVSGSLRSIAHLPSSFTSILFTCPYHHSLLSQIFFLSFVTFNSCFMSTFLIFLVLLRTRLVSIGSKTSHLCHFQFLLRLFLYYPGLCLINNRRSYHRFVHVGPVVQSWVSLTLGSPKIQSKLPDSLSINLEYFFRDFVWIDISLLL